MRMPKGYKALRPVHPNAGIEADYRRRLDALIEEMQTSYAYWLRAAYRANEPEIAQDAAPAPRVTAVEANRGWHVYVDGVLLRERGGAPRIFKTQWSAEGAGLRSTPRSAGALVTDPVLIGQRLDAAALAGAKIAKTPAQTLQGTLDGLGSQWADRFEATAPKLAEWFAQKAGGRSQEALKKILRDGGVSVEFQMTPVMRDIVAATTAENVSLIKSIASQYHTEVEGMVMRSVTAGRDLSMLTGELEDRFGITRRRAAGIALDQNNKATSNVVKVRQKELGVMAIWLHSHAGKVPRKTHLANNGKLYDPAVGWHDPDPKVNRRIWPGELIKCRCVSRTVVKGFS